MKMHLLRLTLHCRQPMDPIELDNNLVLLSGPVSVGKTSMLDLIDYCLGGSHEDSWGPAIRNEIRSVRLDLLLGENVVVLDRAMGSATVDATWSSEEAAPQFVRVPVAASQTEVLPKVSGLSDLLFVLAGIDPVKVPKRASDPESELVRLSFRDLLWFCYLRQERLDSNFFNLYDQQRRSKARWAMRFFCGFYSDRIATLEQRQEELRLKRASANAAAEQLQQALSEISDGATIDELKIRRSELEAQAAENESLLARISAEFRSATHAVDSLREELRTLYRDIDTREKSVEALQDNTRKLHALRAEYIALRMRAERSRVALTIIGDASFDHCPQCARLIDTSTSEASCALCKADKNSPQPLDADALQAASDDLSERIIELEDTITRQETSLLRQRQLLAKAEMEKRQLDDDLQLALKEYDSAYVSRLREGERRLSRSKEALATTNNFVRLYENLQRYQAMNSELTSELARVRAAMQAEMATMTQAQEVVADLEQTFFSVLRKVGVPGVDAADRVRIDRTSWIPWIINDSDPEDEWDYMQGSSGGRRVLFVVCYALALHIVATKYNLPMPTLLIVDTPVKNVERDINKELVERMQREMFECSESSLKDTQMILANGTFEPYPFKRQPAEVVLTRDHGLIPYYHESKLE